MYRDRKGEADRMETLRKDLLHLIIHSTNIFKGPARRLGPLLGARVFSVEQGRPCWHSCSVPPEWQRAKSCRIHSLAPMHSPLFSEFSF